MNRERTLILAGSWLSWFGAITALQSILKMMGRRRDGFSSLGLGVSQLGDAMTSSGDAPFETLGLFISLGFSALFMLLGWLTRHWLPAIFIGTALYALDALVFVFHRHWAGVAVHVVGLMLIVGGYLRYRSMSPSPHLGGERDAGND